MTVPSCLDPGESDQLSGTATGATSYSWTGPGVTSYGRNAEVTAGASTFSVVFHAVNGDGDTTKSKTIIVPC